MTTIKRHTVVCDGCRTPAGKWFPTGREALVWARQHGWTRIPGRTPEAGGSPPRDYCTNCRGGRS